MGQYAVEGHASFYGGSASDSSSAVSRLWGNYRYWVDHFTMRFYINVVDFVLVLFQRYTRDEPLKFKTAG